MTRIRFQQSLEDLKENLLVMAGLAEQAIQRAIEAYRTRDLSICDLVSRSEIAINRMERDIDQTALDLLAMEQPMAIDLRFILSVIKINADLERVGDAAKSISDRVRHMERMGSVDLPVDIPRMASMAADMVRRSLQAFIEGDAELARTVLTMDDAVDQMNRSSYKTLTKVMEESSHLAPQALNALMISRSLERVADHPPIFRRTSSSGFRAMTFDITRAWQRLPPWALPPPLLHRRLLPSIPHRPAPPPRKAESAVSGLFLKIGLRRSDSNCPRKRDSRLRGLPVSLRVQKPQQPRRRRPHIIP